MPKLPYILAITCYLLIPAVTILGGMLFNSINPEIAAGHPNYERNFRLLELAKNLSLLAALLVSMGLWFLTCFFSVKSKKQSYGWLFLAMLGPFGFIILNMLGDEAPARGDMYQAFVGKLRMYRRVAHELCIFVVVWVLAYQTMVLKRKFMIMYEAATTGTSTAQIINRQNASSGMWHSVKGLKSCI
jgi:predicted permease